MLLLKRVLGSQFATSSYLHSATVQFLGPIIWTNQRKVNAMWTGKKASSIKMIISHLSTLGNNGRFKLGNNYFFQN